MYTIPTAEPIKVMRIKLIPYGKLNSPNIITVIVDVKVE
jgi:hypothetical protein